MRFTLFSFRGQATVELALAAPFVVGLLALTLQGGIIISDQVNLEHYAYEGAQWALANPNAPAIGAGSIQEHIYMQMCGAAMPTSNAGTRYCRPEPGGLPNLKATVAPSATPVSVSRPRAVQGVMAATSCKGWYLDVTLGNGTSTMGANATRWYTVKLHVQPLDPNPTTPTPVALSASDYPPGLANGNTFFQPPLLYSDGDTARLTIQTGTNTVPGTYPILITGQDQCGAGPRPTPAINNLTVAAGGSFNPPPAPAAVTVDPVQVGICAGTLTSVHVSGSGFKAGGTVKFGTVPGAGAAVADGAAIDATVALPSGVYDITETNPDLTTGIAAGGLTVLPGAPCPPPAPAVPVHNCSGNQPGAFQTVIDITWDEPLALPLLT
ncbi:MAG TPA: TadE family protein, partial [Candidatus Dormibacteraeota bacterium]|nr:TadE family protein [Candidatus Dormibacteraeota bacterium]